MEEFTTPREGSAERGLDCRPAPDADTDTGPAADQEWMDRGIDWPRYENALAPALGELADCARAERALMARRAHVITTVMHHAEDAHRRWATTHPESSASLPSRLVRDLAHSSAVGELACLLKLTERAAEDLIAQSTVLTSALPRALAALAAGRISCRSAAVITDVAGELPPTVVPRFEERIVAYAEGDVTDAQVAARARRLRDDLHPESLATRRRRCHDDRRVWIRPAGDAMAWLGGYLAAESAALIEATLTALAREARDAPDERRTMEQRRADALVDLLTDPESLSRPGSPAATATGSVDRPVAGPAGRPSLPGTGWLARPVLAVTVPVGTMLGGPEPGWLAGFGRIPADQARQLAAAATSFTRIVTDPADGGIVSIDPRQYRIPAALRRALAQQTANCRFPGCRARADTCDLDHRVPHRQGGTTDAENLLPLCRTHHLRKHRTAWRMLHGPGTTGTDTGTAATSITWVSPGGRRYTSEPEPPPSVVLADPPPF
ncbi:hypothetical protein BKD30_09400 [Tersicoccus phoenicis]|uniref:HNH nuclease domain-containing protein n=1 Tax=Tersicoccus phoenicis TaxID=554083 RepID=A0A1R1L9B0_9MICC|nr:HNH endonuclease signature motif containing protein [Tersicoccus phoenicis]OMH24114.1 hypothetical protein BKD30_09400 [Tersicoccus phoenicis]